jgi:ABC-type polysaccharide/polyol phosphate export permease
MGWSLLNPLVQLIVYFFAFGLIIKVPIENYFVYLGAVLLHGGAVPTPDLLVAACVIAIIAAALGITMTRRIGNKPIYALWWLKRRSCWAVSSTTPTDLAAPDQQSLMVPAPWVSMK